ncbi:trehalose 6-phosphate phosphatase [Sinomonas cellulolyticus]|uniref:trehalose-phosphatase n=1 Tax=Sinomonas cellulolyticus TaxID=2801916 RepID=UPI0019CBDF16|nr:MULTISPECIES: trehalose-phosphatase [Sinomonas]GHG54007.1 trehalose 6-phosphate phosphatase [Sinomonas sp. KCTC 49339]
MSIDDSLRGALQRLAAAEKLLVALDFDGVVAPIVARAEDARPLPETADAVARLAGLPRTWTAYVSGRALASLVAVASPDPRTQLIGSHGAEVRLGGEEHPVTLDPDQRDALADLHRVFTEISSQAPGTWVEEKPAGRVLHTRQADREDAATAVGAAKQQLASRRDIFLKEGKEVLEGSVVHVTKGEGLAFLRQVTEADAVFFAGDDVTDEDGFLALEAGDLGLKVGPGDTAASFRVERPEDVADVVALLAQLRSELPAQRTP